MLEPISVNILESTKDSALWGFVNNVHEATLFKRGKYHDIWNQISSIRSKLEAGLVKTDLLHGKGDFCSDSGMRVNNFYKPWVINRKWLL